MSTNANKKSSLVGSTSTVSSATALSRVFGLVREQVMAWFFGASMATDAFVAAFRIPNLMRDLFAEGALSAAFVPVFKNKAVTEGTDPAFRLANIILTMMLLAVGLIVILGIVAAPALVFLFANGFTEIPVKFDLTVSLTRIMFVYLLLVSVSALFMGMLNSYGRFGIPALSPAMFNLGSILSVIFLYKYFEQPIYTLAIGVVIGGIGQLVLQLPSIWHIGFRYRPNFDFLAAAPKRVLRLFGPMVIGMSGSRVNILVSTLIASFLAEGALSYLNYAYRLMHFPLGVFAVALGTVALPRTSEMVARGQTDRLGRSFLEAMSLNLFIVVPAAWFLAVLGRPAVELIFGWGAFTNRDAANTALALLHYSYGLIGFAAVRVTVPFYYAFEDSRLPMRISLITVAINLALYYPLVQLLQFAGLAAATSIAGLANVLMLLLWLPRKGVEVPWRDLAVDTLKTIVAGGVAFMVTQWVPVTFGNIDSVFLDRLFTLLVPSAVALAVYLGLCLVLRVQGMIVLFRGLRKQK